MVQKAELKNTPNENALLRMLRGTYVLGSAMLSSSVGEVGTLLIVSFLPSVEPMPMEARERTDTTCDNGLAFGSGNVKLAQDALERIFPPSIWETFRDFRLGDILTPRSTAAFQGWFSGRFFPPLMVRFRGGVRLPTLESLLLVLPTVTFIWGLPSFFPAGTMTIFCDGPKRGLSSRLSELLLLDRTLLGVLGERFIGEWSFPFFISGAIFKCVRS